MSMPKLEGAGSLALGHPASRDINPVCLVPRPSSPSIGSCLLILSQLWPSRTGTTALLSGSSVELTDFTSPAPSEQPRLGYQQVDLCPSVHSLILLLLDLFSKAKVETGFLTNVSISVAAVGQDIWNEDCSRKFKMGVCPTDAP